MSQERQGLWLRCKATSGQFSSEVAISGLEHNGEGFSLFAHRRFVECEEPTADDAVDAWLRVEELGRDGDVVLVQLPGRTLANGQAITVRAEDLERHACQEA